MRLIPLDFRPVRCPAVVLSLLPLLLFALTLACGEAEDKKHDGMPESIVKNFRFNLCDTGSQKMRVTAEEMRMPEDQSVARLKNVRIVQLQDGAASGTITANEGVYYLKDPKDKKHELQDLDLHGSVRVSFPSKGFSLRTEHAVIGGEKQKKLVSESGTSFSVNIEDQSIKGNAESFELKLLDGFDTLTFKLKTEKTDKKRAHLRIGTVSETPVSQPIKPKGQKQ